MFRLRGSEFKVEGEEFTDVPGALLSTPSTPGLRSTRAAPEEFRFRVYVHVNICIYIILYVYVYVCSICIK